MSVALIFEGSKITLKDLMSPPGVVRPAAVPPKSPNPTETPFLSFSLPRRSSAPARPMRDQIVDFVRRWSEKTEIHADRDRKLEAARQQRLIRRQSAA